MKKLCCFAILFILLALSMPLAVPVTRAEPEVVRGPRHDYLQVKIYANVPAEMIGYEACEIEFHDWELDPTYIEKYRLAPYNESIYLDDYLGFGMTEFDINWNETMPTYPGVKSPTSLQAFRHALAHLADKDRYVTEVYMGYAVKLDRGPVGPGWGVYYEAAEGADPHPFDPAEAARILDEAGFVDRDGDGIRNYPVGWPGREDGPNLDQLKFFVRSDKDKWMGCAEIFKADLEAVGIPVWFYAQPREVAFTEVFTNHDFHIYTGGWGLGIDPDWMYYLYHSSMHWHPGPDYNYNAINDTELDHYLEIILTPPDIPTAIEAVGNACRRFQEIIGNIPLTEYAGYFSFKRPIVGAVTYIGGVTNDWTFYRCWREDSDMGGTIWYGICTDVQMMNPLYSEFSYDWDMLDNMYEFIGVGLNPYTLADQIASVRSWSVDTWTDPATGEKKHVVTFTIWPNMKFHDGTPVTVDDIIFSYELTASLPESWVYSWISGQLLHHVEKVDDTTFRIYADCYSAWVVHWFSSQPILPKHIWDNFRVTVTGEQVGVGDGETTEFWLANNWEAGLPTVAGTYTIYVDGVPQTEGVDYIMEDIPPGYRTITKTGKIIFLTPPPAGSVITADYQYYDCHGNFKDPNFIGAGPWKFVSYTMGESFVFQANRDYYYLAAPKGDVNYDYIIDIFDIVVVARSFGTEYKYENGYGDYDIRADVMPPWRLIDIFDIVKVASQFGKTWYPTDEWNTIP